MKKILLPFLIAFSFLVSINQAWATGCNVVKRDNGWWIENNSADCKVKFKNESIVVSYAYPDSEYYYSVSSNQSTASISSTPSSSQVWFRTCPNVKCTINLEDLDIETSISVRLVKKAAQPQKKEPHRKDP